MRNLLIRTLKTFVATFLGSLAVIIPTMDFADSKGVIITLLVALASALLTAIMNIPKIKQLLNNYGETPEHIATGITEEMQKFLKDISEEDK